MTGTATVTRHNFDVLIIGGGGAAALAALEAKRTGLTVGLVTKESSPKSDHELRL
jgi:succinate dehydrogenase/fumarate reductase flavoprotein subunit